MNKSELIQALSEKSGIDSELARSVVETTIELMKRQLIEGGRIEIRGFGSFEMREYKAFTNNITKSTGSSDSVLASALGWKILSCPDSSSVKP